MSDYPYCRYTRKEISNAGKMLGNKIIHDPDRSDEISEIFRIAYNWRDSHAFPMRRIRHELVRGLKQEGVSGLTSARMKRMASIRRKLRSSSIRLQQMQDLGGCRAIIDHVTDLNSIIKRYRDGGSCHIVHGESDYISAPKCDGYRSYHSVLRFQPKYEHDAPYAEQKIEIQLRTRLQHSWATAVEAVGMIHGEDYKSGEGKQDWRRFFALMSADFAEQEDCTVVPGTPLQRKERHQELAELSEKLNAVRFLETMNKALNVIDRNIAANAKLFLIQFQIQPGSFDSIVRVKGFHGTEGAAASYGAEEVANDSVNSVLVEVDKAENLKSAYPNYFLDVTMFTDKLRDILTPNWRKSLDHDPSRIASTRTTLQSWQLWRQAKRT